MIKIVELFLSGELDADSFSRELLNDLELENQINQLIPKEAYYNKNHHIWNRLPYGSLLPDGFNCMAFIKRMCKFDGSIADNYNLIGAVEIIYKAVYPKTPCTELYETLAECYLHIAGDCFEGPETEACIEKIVYEIVDIKPKSKRDKTGKELLKNLFHVTDNKRPRWIQGSEWPMGTKTPMQFIDSKRIKDETDEGREYIFRDYETGEEKRIVQYY